MYICDDCYNEFGDPLVEYERHSELGDVYEKFYVCPHCFSSNFTEIPNCELCGNPTEKTFYIGGKEMCQCCRDSVDDRIIKLIEGISEEYWVDYEKAKSFVIEYLGDRFE